MEIKVQVFGCIYSVCIGYKTAWFESLYFISITREWYGQDKLVSYAVMKFHS
jgi:hypothetical protein